MLILPLPVGNMGIAYKITYYIILLDTTPPTHARFNLKHLQGKAALFTEQKTAKLTLNVFSF
jgi:hypothetical protein